MQLLKNRIVLFALILSYIVESILARVSLSKTLEEKYGTIIHVSAIFRHAERSPYAFYPTDPHKSYPWPNGPGQLTMTGKREGYELGKWFRSRYATLLKTVPSHKYIRTDSSDVDRSIMGAQTFLAGLYVPRNTTEQFLDGLQWRPVPVHTIPQKHDNMLYQTAECSTLAYYQQKFFQTRKMKNVFRDHRRIIKYVANHTKSIISKKNIYYAAWTLYEIWDSLRIENQFNLTLPKWTDKIFPTPLTNTVYAFLYKEMDLFKIQRLTAGPFIKSLSADLTARTATANSKNYFHFYFAHDQTIASIMKSFNVYNDINPPYLASLVFELREKNRKNYVTVWYNNSTISPPTLLRLPKCGQKDGCVLKRFSKITLPLIPHDWEHECSLKSTTTEK